MVDGRRVYTHERLRRARSSLSSLVSAGTLFTYLDPALAKAGPLPSREDGGPEWGDRAVWEDLHHRDPYPFWLD